MSPRIAALAICLIAASTQAAGPNSKPPAHVEVTTWSRSAHPLPNPMHPEPSLRNVRVPSPNGKYEIACNSAPREVNVRESVSQTLDIPSCDFVNSSKRIPIDLEVGAEALWAPDSDAVAITHSDGGAVGTYEVLIYRPQSDGPAEIATAVRKDLARRFPACVGVACTPQERHKLRHDTSWVNVAAIRWINKSDRLLILAWVPDSSGYGVNLDKYNGYLVDARTGQIISRYSQHDFTRRFKKYCGDWGL